MLVLAAPSLAPRLVHAGDPAAATTRARQRGPHGASDISGPSADAGAFFVIEAGGF